MRRNFNGTIDIEDHEYKSIYQAYKAAVTSAVELYPLAVPKPFDDIYKNPVPGIPGATASFNNGIVKFSIPELPPHIRAEESIQAKLKYHWRDMIIYAHAKAGIDICFDHGFCLIKIYHKLGAPWDVDNRVYKYIIDGIRYTKMIPDDSSKHLSFMVTGIPKSKSLKTEILLCDFEKVKERMGGIGIL